MKAILAVVAALAVACSTLAGPLPAEFRRTTPCGLEELFRQCDLGCAPIGPTHGSVLYANAKHPQFKAHMQGLIWKGKTFHDDDTFTNRWVGGVRAGSTGVRIEPSRVDGQPCFAMQYSANALVFSNTRDELRQLVANQWLGRSCDACTGELKNWFVLRGK